MSSKLASRLPFSSKTSMLRFFGTVLPACLVVAAFAGCNRGPHAQMEKGKHLFETQQYKFAIEPLTEAAEADYPEAQYCLAKCYLEGLGVEKDVEKAFGLFQKAAEAGHAESLTELGKCCLEGIGTTKDPKAAVNYLRIASDARYGEAMFLLGLCLEKGEGIERDPDRAWELIRMAAEEEELPDAQFYLAERFFNGNGVPRAPYHAVTLYREAAKRDFPPAQTMLGVCYEKGEGVEKDLETAIKWYRRAADRNDSDALAALDRLGAK